LKSIQKYEVVPNSNTQRRRLAAGLVFEKRPAQLQNQIIKLNL